MNIFQELAKKDKQGFNEARRGLYKKNREFGDEFQVVAEYTEEERTNGAPWMAWRNRQFFAAFYIEHERNTRISVNRTELMPCGNWKGDITWDELMEVKRGIGFGGSWMVECYPPDSEVVNVCNMRHLWLTHEPAFGWVKGQTKGKASAKKAFLARAIAALIFWKGGKTNSQSILP
jgi:hypothetical protein